MIFDVCLPTQGTLTVFSSRKLLEMPSDYLLSPRPRGRRWHWYSYAHTVQCRISRGARPRCDAYLDLSNPQVLQSLVKSFRVVVQTTLICLPIDLSRFSGPYYGPTLSGQDSGFQFLRKSALPIPHIHLSNVSMVIYAVDISDMLTRDSQKVEATGRGPVAY